jgi:hypothetical protein
VTSFSTYLSPDEALARVAEDADLIERLAATAGPGGAERLGQIRIAAGRIKDHTRLLGGDDARGIVLEDSETALKAVIDARATRGRGSEA